jgi:Putative esterase
VNSDNNGPYGDAITQELIPHVEKTYRGIGAGYARVIDGASTGGWVSLALQVFYPDIFNGCWSHAPDPVDFRAYELINIYDDANAYVNGHGFERAACRDVNGETRYTVRHECLMERVMGRGDRWETSGKDWCAWNATFGPRGKDGLPVPLWDGATGRLDRSTALLDHWKKYDLRRVLADDWTNLGPKLNGKIHIYVGDGDDYFLNNAVRLLDTSLRRVQPPFEGTIKFGPAKGHGWRGISDKDLLDEMTKAVARGRSER